MELDQALSRVSEIHAQLLRSEIFRGYRALPIAFTGAIAMVAAAVQSTPAWQPLDATAFAHYWIAMAALSSAVMGADILLTLRRDGRTALRRDWARRNTAAVVAQVVPALVIGAVLTALWHDRPEMAPSLPGVWATLFGLGIFSSRPYLPRAVGWVALFYIAAGAVLLIEPAAVPSPWCMGLTFGVGQVGAAMVLYYNLERPGRG